MITTLSNKGKLVIPRDIRIKWGLRKGDDFTVLCTTTGVILLRPIRRRGTGLAKALRGLQGLNLKRQDEPIRRKRGS